VTSHVLAGHRDVAPGGLAQSGQHLDQLVLAVAGNARDAEDLSAADLEADAPDGILAAIVRRPEIADVEDHIARM